jgi:hypothetical protein
LLGVGLHVDDGGDVALLRGDHFKLCGAGVGLVVLRGCAVGGWKLRCGFCVEMLIL